MSCRGANKNYYAILGVAPGESAGAIKSAFRRQAKECHPDRSGAGSTAKFQDLQEAYQALMDCPGHREECDRPHHERAGSGQETRFSSPRKQFCYPQKEPLIPEGRKGKFEAGGCSALGGHAGFLSIRVSSSQAARGFRLPVTIRVRGVCPSCRGTGAGGFLPCDHCLGCGYTVIEEPAAVEIPPFAGAGAVFEVPVRRGQDLRLIVEVDD